MSEQKYEELTLQQAVEAMKRGESVERTRVDGIAGWVPARIDRTEWRLDEVPSLKFRRAIPKQAREYKSVDEVPMGKEWKSKDGKTRALISFAMKTEGGLLIGSRTAKELLNDCIYADGSPCGVIE